RCPCTALFRSSVTGPPRDRSGPARRFRPRIPRPRGCSELAGRDDLGARIIDACSALAPVLAHLEHDPDQDEGDDGDDDEHLVVTGIGHVIRPDLAEDGDGDGDDRGTVLTVCTLDDIHMSNTRYLLRYHPIASVSTQALSSSIPAEYYRRCVRTLSTIQTRTKAMTAMMKSIWKYPA